MFQTERPNPKPFLDFDERFSKFCPRRVKMFQSTLWLYYDSFAHQKEFTTEEVYLTCKRSMLLNAVADVYRQRVGVSEPLQETWNLHARIDQPVSEQRAVPVAAACVSQNYLKFSVLNFFLRIPHFDADLWRKSDEKLKKEYGETVRALQLLAVFEEFPFYHIEKERSTPDIQSS